MKILRITIIFIVIITFEFSFELNLSPVFAQKSAVYEENIRLQWAFGAIRKEEGKPELVSIKQDAVLKSGDQIKFFVKLKTKSFAYLIYHGSKDEINILFPYQFTQSHDNESQQKKYYIPQGSEWLELDKQVGLETFYFLVSTDRLVNLERLIIDHKQATPAKKTQLTKQILQKARALIWKNRRFKRTAEKPVTIMGRLRGSNKTNSPYDITNLAMEVSENNFYGKTFTIDHQ
tara:strand:- start:3299 stop:3997 length:699 start_codon:yes stop_codon:yes gene_type:complete